MTANYYIRIFVGYILFSVVFAAILVRITQCQDAIRFWDASFPEALPKRGKCATITKAFAADPYKTL
jgi:hypothetical protein